MTEDIFPWDTTALWHRGLFHWWVPQMLVQCQENVTLVAVPSGTLLVEGQNREQIGVWRKGTRRSKCAPYSTFLSDSKYVPKQKKLYTNHRAGEGRSSPIKNNGKGENSWKLHLLSPPADTTAHFHTVEHRIHTTFDNYTTSTPVLNLLLWRLQITWFYVWHNRETSLVSQRRTLAMGTIM